MHTCRMFILCYILRVAPIEALLSTQQKWFSYLHFVFVHFVTIISDEQGYRCLQILLSGVCKQWTGQLDCTEHAQQWCVCLDLQLEWAWVHIMLM